MSWRVMETLRMLMPPGAVEVYSVDEAFLDMSHIPAAQLQQKSLEIKNTVEMWTGIKVSIGVAPTKVLSKVANRLAKKHKEATNCVLVLDTPNKLKKALEQTPIGDVWGVGGRYAHKLLNQHGISNAWQLQQMPEAWAKQHLGGVVGVRLIRELNGEPCIEMKDPLEKKKMIATTRMFGIPVFDLQPLKEAVATYTARAAEKLRRQYSAASYIDVFVVTNERKEQAYTYNPQSNHRYVSLPNPTAITGELIKYAVPLVEQLYRKGPKYLKAGVILGGIVPDSSLQGNLFVPPQSNKQRLLMSAIDNINFSMRDDLLKYATSGTTRNWKMRQEMRSQRYTTRWDELYEIG
jgi:DNA polymerase V